MNPFKPPKPVTFGFHARYSVRFGGGLHQGADFTLPTGTPIYACADGKVVGRDAPWGPAFGIDSVLILHKVGKTLLYTIYAHMSHCFVPVGRKVKMGQLIGLVGGEGRVSGPHLHLECQLGQWWRPNAGVDPTSLIKLGLPQTKQC